jgi:hypothetical protein
LALHEQPVETHRRKRIVIVDDHPLMCDALVQLNSSQTDPIAQALTITRLMRAGSPPS